MKDCKKGKGNIDHKPHDLQPQKLRIIIVHKMSIHWKRDDGLKYIMRGSKKIALDEVSKFCGFILFFMF
jgi:hypothetical protein